MRIRIKKIFICLLFSLTFFISTVLCFDINTTSPCEIIAQQALSLVNSPTSMYEDERFIRFVLYERIDTNFSFKDFLTSFGTKSNFISEGFLIIGNDAKMGGVAINSKTVALPIPSDFITEIDIIILPKFFPRGFTILMPKINLYFWASGYENARFNNLDICVDCPSYFGSSDNNKMQIFSIYNFWYKAMKSNRNDLNIEMFGFLEEYDVNSGKGSVDIAFYRTYYKNSLNIYKAVRSYLNQMDFILKSNIINYNGSLMVYCDEISSDYNFTGIAYIEIKI